MYSYTASGLVAKKRLRVIWPGVITAVLEASYSHDNEGRVTGITYPSTWALGGSGHYDVPVAGQQIHYLYDRLGRLQKMLRWPDNWYLVNNAQYGPAGELTALSYLGVSETRQYNAPGQLTRTTGGGVDLEYV